jgi:hypothetical protein
MSARINEPNSFALHGEDTQINYSTTSFVGEPQFHYQTGNFSHQFNGEEISTVETPLGKLVTVLVEPDADGGKEVRLTLLLPAISLPSSGVEEPIQTQAILTTNTTPRRGNPTPLEGQLQTYRALSLTGTAIEVAA